MATSSQMYEPQASAPEPVAGCELCRWWARRRENARRGIGEATVEECDERIATHPHRRRLGSGGPAESCGSAP